MVETGGPPAPGAPLTFRGLRLFPFQQRAVEAILSGRSVLVAAPTGSGKTLVADYAVERALATGRRVVYTSPIKALSNQKFRDFRAHYGEERVGIMTGDVTIQGDAALLVMTTEIFRNTVFEDPRRLDGFDFAIFDEIHYLDDRERGTVWEESIIFAPPHVRIVGLSATVPNVRDFAAWIAEVRATEVDVIEEDRRPVPLVHKTWIPGRGPRGLDEVRRHYLEMGRLDPRRRSRRPAGRPARRSRRSQEEVLARASARLIDHVQERDRLPAIYFAFSRADCERLAHANAARDLLTEEERWRMLDLFDELAERYEVLDAPDTRELRRLAGRGVLYHHAGMLPIDKEIVERLFTTGLVKLLFATETFALGVNMPARTVAFHALAKWDGVRFGRILAREYWQMAGRAGRQGIDEQGFVYALLDDSRLEYHDIERLQRGTTEPVMSRFNLSYGGILSLYDRLGDRVVEAWERSFARWQQRERGRRHPRGPGGARRDGARQIAARLEVLAARGYVEGGRLTPKGRLCAAINGYEIAVTEAWDRGWIARCGAAQLAVLFSSVVYEPRPHDVSARSTRLLKGVAVPFAMHLDALAEEEIAAGVVPPTRGVDYGIADAVDAWARGEDFEAVLARTQMAPGDLVRVLRMTNQLLRQLQHALPAGEPAVEILRRAREAIDRDVVDARRQLELG